MVLLVFRLNSFWKYIDILWGGFIRKEDFFNSRNIKFINLFKIFIFIKFIEIFIFILYLFIILVLFIENFKLISVNVECINMYVRKELKLNLYWEVFE